MACCGLFSQGLRKICILPGILIMVQTSFKDKVDTLSLKLVWTLEMVYTSLVFREIIESTRLYMFNQSLLHMVDQYHNAVSRDQVKLTTFVMSEVVQGVQLIFVLFLLFGLVINRRIYSQAFVEPTIICYAIDTIVSVLSIFFYGLTFHYIHVKTTLIQHVASKLLIPVFLVLVWRYSKNNEDSEKMPIVRTYNKSWKFPQVSFPGFSTSSNEGNVPENNLPNVAPETTEQEYIKNVYLPNLMKSEGLEMSPSEVYYYPYVHDSKGP